MRVGDTVRRPTGPWTPAIHALLRHLEHRGFDGAPRLHGIDEQGREILEESRPYAVWSEKVLLDGVDEDHLKALLDRVEANTQKLLAALRALSPRGGGS